MTLHKFVFSPTGGTKKAASFLCQNWAGKENNIDLTTGTIPRVDFEPGDLAVFALPVYGGRLPPAAVNRLQALKGKKTPAVALVVYGNRAYEDALLELKNTVNSSRHGMTNTSLCIVLRFLFFFICNLQNK